MTSKLSRRDLVALGGVTLLTAACGPRGKPRDNSAPGKRASYPMVGIPAKYGHFAIEDAELIPKLRGKFKPNHISIVYVDFISPWMIEINHASWRYSSTDPARRREKAVQILKLRTAGTRFKNLAAPHIPYRRVDNNKFETESFDKFGFATQSEIFIYFNHPDVELSQYWPITFTPFSDLGYEREPNYSFFNAAVVPFNELDGLSGRMMRVRNYVVDENYDEIKANNANGNYNATYAMNLHFSMPGTTEHVAMVIDPDTGNGVGHEP